MYSPWTGRDGSEVIQQLHFRIGIVLAHQARALVMVKAQPNHLVGSRAGQLGSRIIFVVLL
jgi:hypothetical protein